MADEEYKNQYLARLIRNHAMDVIFLQIVNEDETEVGDDDEFVTIRTRVDLRTGRTV